MHTDASRRLGRVLIRPRLAASRLILPGGRLQMQPSPSSFGASTTPARRALHFPFRPPRPAIPNSFLTSRPTGRLLELVGERAAPPGLLPAERRLHPRYPAGEQWRPLWCFRSMWGTGGPRRAGSRCGMARGAGRPPAPPCALPARRRAPPCAPLCCRESPPPVHTAQAASMPKVMVQCRHPPSPPCAVLRHVPAPSTLPQRCRAAPRPALQAQLTGPCSLCGSKRSTSCWRRLPACTGHRAGQPACKFNQTAVAGLVGLGRTHVHAACSPADSSPTIA